VVPWVAELVVAWLVAVAWWGEKCVKEKKRRKDLFEFRVVDTQNFYQRFPAPFDL
jgi:hypothetical protein